MTIELSVCIPTRSEVFLARTIQDILEHSSERVEIIAVLDGEWADPGVVDHERVILVKLGQSVGQRAATNIAAKMARGKYVMKTDAHCAFSPGFDEILLADMKDNYTMIPVMRNLHVFDFVCKKCGNRIYQGPEPPACPKCGSNLERDIVWIAKSNPQSTAYRFNTELHFEYWNDFKKRPEGKGDLTETLSIQGSCFLMTKERYFALNICDEEWGSWGNQGTEVSCKTWLSGGRVVVNHKTYYAHMFRVSSGVNWGFPYPLSGKEVEYARKCSRDLFFNNKFEKQIYPLSWLIEKFAPVPDWHDESGKDTLTRITEAGRSFRVVLPLTNLTSPHPLMPGDRVDGSGEKMPPDTVGLTSV